MSSITTHNRKLKFIKNVLICSFSVLKLPLLNVKRNKSKATDGIVIWRCQTDNLGVDIFV